MRRILKLLALLLVVVAAVLAAGLAFVHTAPGGAFLAGLVKNSLDGPGTTVEIEGLEIVWGGKILVEKVSMADAEGPWLKVDKTEIDWQPLALLRRQLAIDLLAVGVVTLDRRPVATDAPIDDTGGGGLPGAIPVGIDIAEFDIGEINLGAALTKDPVRLISSGTFQVRPSPLILEGKVEIERDDDIYGRLDADFAFRPDTLLTQFELTAREPRGGVIARLLEIDALPAIDLSLQGDGPIDDWRASLAVALDDVPTVKGQLTLDRAQETTQTAARQLRFDLDGEIGRLMPQSVRPLFAGSTASTGELQLSEDFAPLQGRLETTTGALSITAAGVFAPDRLSAELDARLLAPVALSLGDRRLSAGTLNVSAQASGTLENAVLNATVDGRDVETAEGSLTDLAVSVTSRHANLSAESLEVPALFDVYATIGSVVDPRYQSFAGQSRVYGEITLRPNRHVDITSFSLSTAGLQAALSGAASPGTVRIKGTVTTPDLSAFSALSGRSLSGSSKISFSAHAAPANRSGTIELNGTGQDLAFGIGSLDPLLSGTTRLTGSLGLAADGEWTAKGLQIATPSLEVDLSGSGDLETISGQMTAKLAKLDRVNADLSGQLDLSVTADGPLSGPKLLAELKSDRLNMFGEPVEKLELSADLVASLSAPSGVVQLEAELRGQPVSGNADLSTDPSGIRRIDDLSFKTGSTRLSGNLVVDADNLPSGTLDLASPDLAEIAPLLLRDLSGALNAKVRISAIDGKPVAQVNATGREIASDGNRIGSADLTATISGLDKAPHVDGKLVAGDIQAGAAVVESLAIDAAGTVSGTAFSAKAVLPDGGLEIDGQVSDTPSGISIVLNRGSGRYQKLETNLSAPAKALVRKDGTVALETVSLALGDGRATIAGTAGKTIDLTIGLKAVPAALADAFAPDLGLGGLLSGDVAVTGSGAAPVASWSARWQGANAAKLAEFGLPPANVTSKGRFAGKNVTHDTSAVIGDGGKLAAKGSVALGEAPTLDMSVTGTLPFQLVQRQLTQSGLRLDGAAEVDMRVGGSTSAPAIEGRITSRGATLVSLNTGLVIKDLNLGADISREQVRIASFSGQIGNGGAISGSGTVGLTGSMPADLSLTVRDGTYTDGRIVTAKLDADLTVSGALTNAPVLGGIIQLKRTDITIPQALPTSLAPVDVKHVNAPARVTRQTAQMTKGSRSGSSKGIALNLSIIAPSQIFVRGRGLQAELGGQIGITGTSADPDASGAFTLKYGTLSVLSRVLTFTRGTITFLGSFDPVLDFAATTTVNSTAITVGVAGNATDPKVEFTSTPDYPQEEILALLLFNQNLSNLSAAQVAQLASAVASLGGADPLDKLRKALGVDAINIVTDDNNQTSVEVRKRVSDRVNLGVQQGTQQGSSRVTVDIDVTKNLRARGETDASGESKAGIFFEKEF